MSNSMTDAANTMTGDFSTMKHALKKPIKRSSMQRRRKALAWIFMIPFFVVNFLVILGPSLSAFYYSFTNWSGVGPAQFVGLANFVQLLHDPDFLQAILYNLIWVVAFLTIPVAVGLVGAFILSQIKRLQMFFRTAYFIPYVTASVINAVIWQQLLNPQQGLAFVLDHFGIHWLDNVYFFGNIWLALPTVIFVDIWHVWGFLVVIFLAAMQSIDPELYHAAQVDGAGRWQQFLHVTIPGIKPILGLVMLLCTIWSLLVFEYPFIMTHGGPAGSTQVITLLLYQDAFTLNQAGYAAAMGLCLSILAAIVTGFYLYLRRKGFEN